MRLEQENVVVQFVDVHQIHLLNDKLRLPRLLLTDVTKTKKRVIVASLNGDWQCLMRSTKEALNWHIYISFSIAKFFRCFHCSWQGRYLCKFNIRILYSFKKMRHVVHYKKTINSQGLNAGIILLYQNKTFSCLYRYQLLSYW